MHNLCKPLLSAEGRVKSMADRLSYNAKIALREIILLYKATFGWRSAPSFINHPLIYTAHIAIPYMKQGDVRWSLCFDTCVSGLWHISFVFAICRYLLRALEHLLGEAGISLADLPSDAAKTLKYFRTRVWKSELQESLQSQYCISSKDQPQSRTLESLMPRAAH